MRRKLITMLLLSTCIISLVACGKEKDKEEPKSEETSIIEDVGEASQQYVDEAQDAVDNYNQMAEDYANSLIEQEPKEAEKETETIIVEPRHDELAYISTWIPDIAIDLRYAGDNNFTGQKIYDFDQPQLRYGTIKKLSKAQEMLAEKGYSLIIYDGYRPIEAQFKLWEVCPNPVYVANPNKGSSNHNHGDTVDIGLLTLDGELVEMPSEFDEFNKTADRDYADVSDTAAKNSKMLEDIMKECGFSGYKNEWWHYEDVDEYGVIK